MWICQLAQTVRSHGLWTFQFHTIRCFVRKCTGWFGIRPAWSKLFCSFLTVFYTVNTTKSVEFSVTVLVLLYISKARQCSLNKVFFFHIQQSTIILKGISMQDLWMESHSVASFHRQHKQVTPPDEPKHNQTSGKNIWTDCVLHVTLQTLWCLNPQLFSAKLYICHVLSRSTLSSYSRWRVKLFWSYEADH